MRVRYIGVGEAFDESLPNTSILVEANGGNLLIDCGYSVPPQFWRRIADAEHVDIIYITHLHADHILGLPALLLRMWEEGRKKPLTIISHESHMERLQGLLDYGYPGFADKLEYPIEYVGIKEGEDWHQEPFTLRIALTEHSLPNYAVRVEADGKIYCHSGDGMFTDASTELFEGADLLTHEAFKRDEEVWGHASMAKVKELADRLGLAHVDMVHINRSVRREIPENQAFVKGWGNIPEPDTIRHL